MTDSANNNERVLDIYLNDTEVGTLTLLPDDRTLFAFNKSYIENPDRPILSLWFKTPLAELKTEEKIRRNAMLPPFFSNLLPEGHLREYLAKKANVKQGREFFLLPALGKDLPGAVRIRSSQSIYYNEKQESKLPENKRIFRFSLAGVQLKLSAIKESKDGLTIPADGTGGSWIIKLPSLSFKQLPEAEYSMLKLAEAIGIDVPECKLIPTASIAGLPADIDTQIGDSLAVKRFDRASDGKRIHMEDFAQVFGLYPNQKYEESSFDRIGYVILSEAGEDDFFEYIKRLVFSVVIGNGDMHAKNWSLLYTDAHKPRLSPAYDFVPSVLFLPNDDLGLKLGGVKTFKEIRERNFAVLASRAAASERQVLSLVREASEQIHHAWKKMRSDLPLPAKLKTALDSHMKNLNIY